ncbi:hypothetical protein SODALDRAFT_377298 [Sodiomyces alkalinus F11]|uniref:Uncharacterized protein n=1 Tax=Sodiomyces alkalinus (strain CBS 110278 / VKM F-3762 / F11) TaxID=1314773 RepID=A0A3N2Q4E7_SODAK|nr:hypothetical protein SODALDRAFT_377298 [Sodiomyces alkalinus F11]ROT41640.1 hypothetical protein SODALDRAFT_377298 [Sodiomyces alkalinus F11]
MVPSSSLGHAHDNSCPQPRYAPAKMIGSASMLDLAASDSTTSFKRLEDRTFKSRGKACRMVLRFTFRRLCPSVAAVWDSRCPDGAMLAHLSGRATVTIPRTARYPALGIGRNHVVLFKDTGFVWLRDLEIQMSSQKPLDEAPWIGPLSRQAGLASVIQHDSISRPSAARFLQSRQRRQQPRELAAFSTLYGRQALSRSLTTDDGAPTTTNVHGQRGMPPPSDVQFLGPVGDRPIFQRRPSLRNRSNGHRGIECLRFSLWPPRNAYRLSLLRFRIRKFHITHLNKRSSHLPPRAANLTKMKWECHYCLRGVNLTIGIDMHCYECQHQRCVQCKVV